MVTTSDSAYAFLIVNYLSNLEEPLRFLVLGFEDIANYLSFNFTQLCKGVFIKPSGDLAPLSNLRKTDSPCLIALDWEDVGKYASWTTSFKILTENPITHQFFSSNSDIHDPSDVFLWLSGDNDALKELIKFICEQHNFDFNGLSFTNLRNVLTVFRSEIIRTPSFAAVAHPRRIVEAIDSSIACAKDGLDVSMATFLRGLGMESNSEFLTIQFFGKTLVSKETIQEYVSNYQKVLRNYLTVPYEKGAGKLRKTLSKMGLYLMQHVLSSLAEKENETGGDKNWTNLLIEFEKVDSDKRRSRRKYDTNSYGALIMGRSPISGLPASFRFVLERSSSNSDNLLPRLYQNDLSLMISAYKKEVGDPYFSFLPLKLTGSNTLAIEYNIGTNLIIDSYLRGLRAPNRKINSLLLKLGVG